MGGKMDRFSLQLCDLLALWASIDQNKRARAYRRMKELEHETKRQQKLLQKRKREQERLAGVAPRPKTKKQVEHEDKPQCVKCGKRPAVKGELCNPCFEWEHAKLGRE